MWYTPPGSCWMTGVASSFWPVASKCTPFHGMIVCTPGTFVATSAARMSSALVEPARLMASTRICSATTSREVLSFRSLPARALKSASTGAMAGRLFVASSAKDERVITPSASDPAPVMKVCSWNPADCARMAGGL